MQSKITCYLYVVISFLGIRFLSAVNKHQLQSHVQNRRDV